jgi:endo-1,4-beta-xylanase
MTKKKVLFALIAFQFLMASGCGDGGGGDSSSYNIDDIADEAKLKNIYAGKFLIGNIINDTYMAGKHNKYLLAHYNTVTCENDMKPDYLAKTSGSYTFDNADKQVDAMIAAGMQVHGHTLVWHSQTPSWLTANNAETNMKNYIDTVMKHFAGRIKSWDVVNEAFPDNLHERAGITTPVTTTQDWKVCLRESDSGWFKALGADYIETAFKTARAADPDAILYYNDYGLNGTNKPMAIRNMIEDVNKRYKDETNGTRNLIEGIGMQGHYGSWLNDEANFSKLKGNIEYYLELGIRVDISELDIAFGSDQQGTNQNSAMSSADANAQAQAYAKLFRLLIELDTLHPDQITRVTMWGIDDKTNWKSKGNPCLFDGNLNPKPAFRAVSDPNSY